MKLSKELELWRCDRPDEWKMDEFRRNAEKLEAECLRLELCLASKTDIANQLKDSLADVFERRQELRDELAKVEDERDEAQAQLHASKAAIASLQSSVQALITSSESRLAIARAERDALAAMVETLKTAYKDLCGAINDLDETDSDSEEIIDEMWGQVFSVMSDGWNSLSREPQQHLAEIRAEAVESLLPKCIYSADHKVEIITKDMVKYNAKQIRQGGA